MSRDLEFPIRGHKLTFVAAVRPRKLPRKEPRQRRSRTLCDAIRTSAARVFDAVGYEAATTSRIANVAGVSVGSLYQYYPRKAALVTAEHPLRKHIFDA